MDHSVTAISRPERLWMAQIAAVANAGNAPPTHTHATTTGATTACTTALIFPLQRAEVFPPVRAWMIRV